ncbi:hypothetical protein N0V90_013345 [Kalmusia sp. IMI 367209]|nr:hypothetical protein N0V90_013345 [Kalmusia sp. IMI 367209]
MRLLQRLSSDDFELTSFDDDHPPPYAILSHTWIEGQEVTYDELVDGIGRDKTGYNKIRFCSERVVADNLQYFWVDTCCIDKSTNNELNTAINSMFRWYQRATKCYVYLSDVAVPEEVPDVQAFRITWSEAFRRSRWFTRGWTLQELLAPAIVEFYSKEGRQLGSKVSLDAREMVQIGTLLANESRCERVAITGLGGVGKTQIALEFAHRWREKYADCAVFWIPVTNVETMLETYLEVGQQLQIPNVEQQQSEVQKLVQRKLSLESSGRWLLVFDNADDIDIWTEKASGIAGSGRQIDLLPKSKYGSILFTTRSRKAATKLAGKNVVFVSEMTDADAKGLLQKSLINHNLLVEDQAATDLLLKLTRLPLAIIQAAAYINENDISLSEYAMLLDDTEENIINVLSEEFEDEGRYADIKNPIATTWLISFEQIRTRYPLAAEYLSFMSCVAAKDIPQPLLPPAASVKQAVDAIGTLSAYSFVTRHKTGQLLDLHRLVHLATRSWMRTEGVLGKWSAKVLQRLTEVFPNDDHANRSVWRMYLPHAKYVLESDFEEDLSNEKTDLLWKFGKCTQSDRRYEDAEMAYTKFMERRKRVLGEEHPGTLACMNDLAIVYGDQDRWEEAEELELQVLEKTKRSHGEEHRNTLTSMNNLALVFSNQGRWKEAEELQLQVIEKKKLVFGEEHPKTVVSINNLAVTYTKQGRWKEVEELQLQVIEKLKRAFGEEHPQTLTGMNNRAYSLYLQSRNEEAILMLEKCFQLCQRVFGPHHPSTEFLLKVLNQWRTEHAELGS